MDGSNKLFDHSVARGQTPRLPRLLTGLSAVLIGLGVASCTFSVSQHPGSDCSKGSVPCSEGYTCEQGPTGAWVCSVEMDAAAGGGDDAHLDAAIARSDLGMDAGRLDSATSDVMVLDMAPDSHRLSGDAGPGDGGRVMDTNPADLAESDAFDAAASIDVVPLSVCGDGRVTGDEACDDGNEDNTDACTNVCEAARCGDGFVGPGEQCDDGNTDDDLICTRGCQRPVRVANFEGEEGPIYADDGWVQCAGIRDRQNVLDFAGFWRGCDPAGNDQIWVRVACGLSLDNVRYVDINFNPFEGAPNVDGGQVDQSIVGSNWDHTDTPFSLNSYVLYGNGLWYFNHAQGCGGNNGENNLVLSTPERDRGCNGFEAEGCFGFGNNGERSVWIYLSARPE